MNTKHATVTLRNVDLNLLNEQRRTLESVLADSKIELTIAKRLHLEGLNNLLDHWFDKEGAHLLGVDKTKNPLEPGKEWISTKEGAKYPEDAIEIIPTELKGTLSFIRIGYCQVHNVGINELEKFKKDFRPVTADDILAGSKLKPCYFGMDDTVLLMGYTDGSRWNGFGVPLVDEQTLKRFLALYPEMTTGDQCHICFAEDGRLLDRNPEENTEWVIEPKTYEGVPVPLYDVGLGWCWSAYEIDGLMDDLYEPGCDMKELFNSAVVPDHLMGIHNTVMKQCATEEEQ